MAVAYCPRCGCRAQGWEPFDARFCVTCWDGVADEAHARELVEAAAEGRHDALRMLSEIADERAADVLIEALQHDDASVRRASLEALALVGDVRAVEAVVGLLDDDDTRVRIASVDCLGALGSTAAADALAERLDDEELHVHAATALGSLRDTRALEPLIGLLPPPWPTQARAIAALGWLGDDAAVPHLLDSLDRLAAEWEADPQRWGALECGEAVAGALISLGGQEAEEAVQSARERFGGRPKHWPLMPVHYLRTFTYPEDADERRTVPKWSLELRPVEQPIAEPVTKFGGQPVWLEEPTWPLTRDGTPMTFFAQFRLPEPSPRLVYLFVDVQGDLQRSEDGDASVFVQPGARPETFERRSEGPTYVSSHYTGAGSFTPRVERGLVESAPALVEGRDPPEWEDTWDEEPETDFDWNKLAGIPRFLQGDEWPEGSGWSFLAQFTADQIGHEFGDVAQCYVFVRDDGRGAFFWQCH